MEIIPVENKRKKKKPRVAAYARVSTLTEEQESSYESQVNYFTTLIRNNPNWEFVEVYADQGKSGLRASKRPNFLRMIEDAKAGKIDIILVKSISRFGRNSLEAQEFAHILKEYDVEVRFEREELSTFDPQAEMVFNFLTAVAEEESRSIRENTIWTYRRLAEQGIRHIGNNRVLGYDEVDGVLTPNDQAWIPKLIFERFAEGKCYADIADELEEKEAERLRCKSRFTPTQIMRVLQNEIYVGDRRLQKQAPVDHKTKKPMKNVDYESYYIEDDHEGIVSREMWDAVQNRIEATEKLRKNGVRPYAGSHFLYGRILCGECGEPMVRRADKYKGEPKIDWMCRDRRKGKKGNGCKNLIVPEEELLEALSEALGAEWNGAENVDEQIFNNLKTVKIYDDGRIEVDLNDEKKTA